MENRREQKERNRERDPNPATLDHSSKIRKDHIVTYSFTIGPHIYIFIYWFNLLSKDQNPTTAGSALRASTPRKERRRKGKWEERRKGKGSRHRGLNPLPIPGNWGAYRGRRTERKAEKEQRNRDWVPNPAAPDYLVASYDPHGSYGGPIMKPPSICIWLTCLE